MELGNLSRSTSMVDSPDLFDELVSSEDARSTSSRCAFCKGTKMLCGKDRCSVLARFFSSSRVRGQVDRMDIDGSSPPSVFVGRMGYPSVSIGPMIPPFHGDTMLLDTPEKWQGLSIDDIIDFRSSLVRGMHRVDVGDVENSNRLVVQTRELALAESPPDVDAQFSRRPHGHITVDDDVQPFGPSAPLQKFDLSNFRFDRRLEKAFYDTDLTARNAVMSLYKGGTMLSQIQRAFSVGAFGMARRRRFVPTRWSITAVDSQLGLDMLKQTKVSPTIDEYRIYETVSLDNRWIVLMMPTSWRYELIEAWYPRTAWNPTGTRIAMMSDHEFHDGRKTYASIGGCYYAARMAVNELLTSERRQAGVCIMREAHPGYILPVGVWNVRENVRAALRTKPMRFDTLRAAMGHASTVMDIPMSRWVRSSALLKDALYQRRIDDTWC